MKNDGVAGTVFTLLIRVLIIVVAIVIIYRGAGMCYDYGYRIFQEPPISGGEGRVISVTIPEDISAQNMGKLLEAKGLVRDARLCVLQYYCSEYRLDIKAGTYDLSTAMTAEEMFAVMAGQEWEADTDDH